MWWFKNKRVQFIQIDVAYTDYLRKRIDLRIPAEHGKSVSEMRPFIGILMTHDDIE
ncbi:type III toxin-antitoxin system ToxN/AbiQ family toxin [[Clostridium] innocuum]|nr:type III toxin-antitoxin system ToxN/AbiQ family toxin [[Clostridium] innocuum]